MKIHRSIALLMAMSLPGVAAGAVLNSLAPFLVNHYTFDNPLSADPLGTVELDLGSDETNIQLDERCAARGGRSLVGKPDCRSKPGNATPKKTTTGRQASCFHRRPPRRSSEPTA